MGSAARGGASGRRGEFGERGGDRGPSAARGCKCRAGGDFQGWRRPPGRPPGRLRHGSAGLGAGMAAATRASQGRCHPDRDLRKAWVECVVNEPSVVYERVSTDPEPPDRTPEPDMNFEDAATDGPPPSARADRLGCRPGDGGARRGSGALGNGAGTLRRSAAALGVLSTGALILLGSALPGAAATGPNTAGTRGPALSRPALGTAQAGGFAEAETLEGTTERIEFGALEPAILGSGGAAMLRIVSDEPASYRVDDPLRVVARLHNGDRFHGRLLAGSGELLALELTGKVLLSVPIESLASVIFEGRIPEGESTAAPESGDLLLWKRGNSMDRVEGLVEEFTDEGLRFDSRLGVRVFPWEEVAGLHVEALDALPEPEPGTADRPRVAVDLVDPGRLHGRLMALSSGGCVLELPHGESITLPLNALSELVVDDGRLMFLSERDPDRAEEPSPFGDDLGMQWPYRMNSNVSGGPIRVAGRRYGRGIGVHAPSRLHWSLQGESWKELRVSVGLDDEVMGLPVRGSVVFRVLVDGEERWASGVMRAGQDPVVVPPIRLEGAAELTLEADMAGDLHVGDRANWIRPLLVAGER